MDSGKPAAKKPDINEMMKIVAEEAATLSDEVKAERMEKYYANFTITYGENATAVQRCMFSEESKNSNV